MENSFHHMFWAHDFKKKLALGSLVLYFNWPHISLHFLNHWPHISHHVWFGYICLSDHAFLTQPKLMSWQHPNDLTIIRSFVKLNNSWIIFENNNVMFCMILCKPFGILTSHVTSNLNFLEFRYIVVVCRYIFHKICYIQPINNNDERSSIWFFNEIII